ncbi:MAG: hypothetical protein ACOYJG_08710 [Prevotella sp.]|jgi:hypothetical protein
MDIIQRNFFRLLLSGSLGVFEKIEPMSAFKWNRLMQIAKIQGVTDITLKGIRNYQHEKACNIPDRMVEEAERTVKEQPAQQKPASKMANPLFKRRLAKIRRDERHAMDCSVETLELLNIIVANVYSMINAGVSLKLILDLGGYLRTKGDKVDFVKLDTWLASLHIQRMAQLEGSILIEVFDFEQAEIPFVSKVEKSARAIVLRSLYHNEQDDAAQWHLQQNRSGFITNNSGMLRRNLKRSMKYFDYAPFETMSSFMSNIAKSFSEIEE